jgi:hypothetical protein
MAELGAFTKGPSSDAAKQLWAKHLGFVQGRLSVNAETLGGERLPSAPPLPKQGTPDDPGRLLKDWNYYKYQSNGSMNCSMNKFCTDARWPGLNKTPEMRHHLAVIKRLEPRSMIDPGMFNDLPRLEPGPAYDFIERKQQAERAAEQYRTSGLQHHKRTVKERMLSTTARREALQMRAFAEPSFRGASR